MRFAATILPDLSIADLGFEARTGLRAFVPSCLHDEQHNAGRDGTDGGAKNALPTRIAGVPFRRQGTLSPSGTADACMDPVRIGELNGLMWSDLDGNVLHI